MTSATRSGDNPARFRSSRVVGAHFGLTPRKHQSGETDVTGRISRIGDHGVRVALYEAANVILTRAVTGSDLKSWALGVARRAGMRKAKVALARKLAVVLHRMLADGTTFMASNLHGQQGSPISGCGRLGSTGGNEGSGGLGTSPVRKQVPSPGRWIRSGRICGSSGSPTARPEIGRPVLIRPYQAAATRRLRTEARPRRLALPHFWWKGISPRAVIPLEANAVLGSPASCCQFAIGAARKIDKGAALQDVAAPRWP